MIKLKDILTESDVSLSVPKKIVAHYQASDGFEKEETFTNVDDLKKWIDEWVGLNGEISDAYNYIVSSDGVGRIHVKGLKPGELRTLLGRKPLPKVQGNGYGKEIAKTAYLLNLPKNIQPLGKFEDSYEGQGMSCIFDFEGEPVKNKRVYGKPLADVRLYFHIEEDKWAGDMGMGVSLVYFGEGWDQVRVVDEWVHFNSEGNRESDLKAAEKLFEIPKIKYALQYLEQHPEKIKGQKGLQKLS